MPAKLANGTNYNITIDSQPNNPSQVCAVQNGAGTVANSHIATILVTCTPSPSIYAYAGIRHSVADPTLSQIQYFAFDPATGRLSLQGKMLFPRTYISTLTATPSGKQLLVSADVIVSGEGRTQITREDLTLYDLPPTSGAPSLSRLISSPGRGDLFHPNGVDLYFSGGDKIEHYSLISGAVQGQSLRIGQVSGSPSISSDGKFLFVPASDVNPDLSISQFIAVVSLIDPLRPQLAFRVTTPIRPQDTVISPDGRLLYVTPLDNGNPGYIYSIDALGNLTQTSTFTVPPGSRFPLITTTGSFLYVTNQTDNKVYGFRLDGSGGVTPFSNSYTVPSPNRLIISPDANYLYALTSSADLSQGEIYGFRIGTDGSLTPVAGSPFANGERIITLTFANVNP